MLLRFTDLFAREDFSLCDFFIMTKHNLELFTDLRRLLNNSSASHANSGTISRQFLVYLTRSCVLFTKNKLLHHFKFYFIMDFDPMCSVHSPGSSKTTPLRLRTPPPPYTSRSLTAAAGTPSRQLTTSTKQKEQQ